jgi:hypothetical protein
MRILNLRSESGGASLLAVLFTSFVITIITLAMASLMTGELHQATDAEDGVKAFYTAQSGSEEAVYALKKLRLADGSLAAIDQNCDHDNVLSSFGYGFQGLPEGGITCRKVRVTDTVAGSSPLNVRDADQYDLSKTTFDHIDFKWDLYNWDTTQPNFSSITPGTPNIPPYMEITVVAYQKDASTPPNVTSQNVKSLILKPSWVNSGPFKTSCPTSQLQVVDFQSCSTPDATSAQFAVVACSNDTQYRCQVRLTNLVPAGYQAVIRVRTHFGSASYQMVVYNGAVPVAIPLGHASIDVTAKVGDSFRRVTQNVDIQSNIFSGLGDVLFADENLCKDLRIIGDSNAPSASDTVDENNGICPIGNN